MDRNTHIPGPAGEDNVYVSLTGTQRSGLADNGQNQATSSSGHGSKKSLCHMSKTCEAENVTVEVLKITPSINGETSLLLKDAVGVMKASLTREATRCFGSIHVGDTLVLNKVRYTFAHLVSIWSSNSLFCVLEGAHCGIRPLQSC